MNVQIPQTLTVTIHVIQSVLNICLLQVLFNTLWEYIQCHCVCLRLLVASLVIFMLKVILVVAYMYSIVHFNLNVQYTLFLYFS